MVAVKTIAPGIKINDVQPAQVDLVVSGTAVWVPGTAPPVSRLDVPLQLRETCRLNYSAISNRKWPCCQIRIARMLPLRRNRAGRAYCCGPYTGCRIRIEHVERNTPVRRLHDTHMLAFQFSGVAAAARVRKHEAARGVDDGLRLERLLAIPRADHHRRRRQPFLLQHRVRMVYKKYGIRFAQVVGRTEADNAAFILGFFVEEIRGLGTCNIAYDCYA